MYKIYFYTDRNGKSQVKEYLSMLALKNDKDSRIKLTKIRDYIKVLSEHGTLIGEPYIKHIDGEIWELRPLRDRFLFAAWDGSDFIILHQFTKKTQKTPPREKEKAKRNLHDYFERRHGNGT